MHWKISVKMTKLDNLKAPDPDDVLQALCEAIEGLDTIEIGDENDTMYSIDSAELSDGGR